MEIRRISGINYKTYTNQNKKLNFNALGCIKNGEYYEILGLSLNQRVWEYIKSLSSHLSDKEKYSQLIENFNKIYNLGELLSQNKKPNRVVKLDINPTNRKLILSLNELNAISTSENGVLQKRKSIECEFPYSIESLEFLKSKIKAMIDIIETQYNGNFSIKLKQN